MVIVSEFTRVDLAGDGGASRWSRGVGRFGDKQQVKEALLSVRTAYPESCMQRLARAVRAAAHPNFLDRAWFGGREIFSGCRKPELRLGQRACGVENAYLPVAVFVMQAFGKLKWRRQERGFGEQQRNTDLHGGRRLAGIVGQVVTAVQR